MSYKIDAKLKGAFEESTRVSLMSILLDCAKAVKLNKEHRKMMSIVFFIAGC